MMRPLIQHMSRPVLSESSLSAWRNLGSLATHWANSENADQTGRMPRLIWVIAGRKASLLVLTWGGSYFVLQMHVCSCIFSLTRTKWAIHLFWCKFRQIKPTLIVFGMLILVSDMIDFRKLSCPVIKPTKRVCAQRRFRSAWASAQSDQRLRCPHEESLGPVLALCSHWAHSEDSDETGRIRRLIWVFAGRTATLLVLSCRGSIAFLREFCIQKLLRNLLKMITDHDACINYQIATFCDFITALIYFESLTVCKLITHFHARLKRMHV